MRRTGALLTVLLLALTLPTASGAAFGGLSQQSVDADVVVMTADVGADGDANWTVAYRIRLETDNETQAFEDLQGDIEQNTSAYTERFGERMDRTARAGENATGREMAIENVSVDTSQESFGQEYGVVTYRFEWTNFAAVSDGQLRVGDAISGLFLDSETSLTVSWPEDYRTTAVSPSPDQRTNASVTWRGQRSFGTDEPRVTLSTAGGGGAGSGLVAPLLAVVALALLAVGGYVGYGRLRGDDTDEPTQPSASESDSAAAAASTADTPPADLLSNEEQVLQLLEQNGGRMKQQQVASDLDWTDAKTSQVIGGLRDDDEVETFRIGRENVVTLPDTDVTGDTDDEDSS